MSIHEEAATGEIRQSYAGYHPIEVGALPIDAAERPPIDADANFSSRLPSWDSDRHSGKSFSMSQPHARPARIRLSVCHCWH